jgi:hypothetical protein
MGTTERAFSNLANLGPSPAEKARHDEINRSIAHTMRSVVADRYNPHVRDRPAEKVTPAGAVVAKVVGERWIDAQPLEAPGGATSQRLIEGMVNAALPHGVGNPEYRGAAAEAELARAVAAARATEPEPISAAPEPPAPEPVLATAVAEPVANVLEPARAAPMAGGTLTRRRLA